LIGFYHWIVDLFLLIFTFALVQPYFILCLPAIQKQKILGKAKEESVGTARSSNSQCLHHNYHRQSFHYCLPSKNKKTPGKGKGASVGAARANACIIIVISSHFIAACLLKTKHQEGQRCKSMTAAMQ